MVDTLWWWSYAGEAEGTSKSTKLDAPLHLESRCRCATILVLVILTVTVHRGTLDQILERDGTSSPLRGAEKPGERGALYGLSLATRLAQ
jgi:hypothetical protein|tara:strand:+ start:232 stop:501 length:270 start_codon:yes stop_codon:yes gene_type:complete